MQNEYTPSKKSSTTSKWLIGCGIGCAVIIIILAILGISGFFFIKNITQDFKETESMMETLTERYGEIKDFCPDPDGALKPERIKTFLAVREAMAPARQKLERSFLILSGENRRSRLEKIKIGIESAALIAEFYRSRTQGLLDHEMGMGEYWYIYVLSYYSWLGKSPADGPGFKIRDEDQRKGVFIGVDEESLEERLDQMLRRIHRLILPMLRNQFTKLTEGSFPGVKDSWRKALAAEIEAMESDRFRLPWQDRLPEILETSLKPYRESLEASYSKMLNILELVYIQR